MADPAGEQPDPGEVALADSEASPPRRRESDGVRIGEYTGIETAEQLYQAIEQMGRMQRLIESYRGEGLGKNPRNFAMLAEGPLEQLRQLQKQIDEYIQHIQSTGLPASS